MGYDIMNILPGLLKELKKLSGSKKNIGYVDIKNLKEEDVANLTSGEIDLLINGWQSYSEDYNFVVARLNNILKALEEKDTSYGHILSDFLSDISNWNSRIFVEEKRQFFWKYYTSADEKDESKHYLLELRCCGRKVMVVEVATTLKGKIERLHSRYHTDISDYGIVDKKTKNVIKFGTMVIDVECQGDERIVFSDVIYNLDLLDGNKRSNDELVNNMLSQYHDSINCSKIKR